LKRKLGFSILELMVVVGITVVLLAGSVFGYVNVKRKAVEAKAKSDMVAFGQAVNQYHNLYANSINTQLSWPSNVSNAALDSDVNVNKIPDQLTSGAFWSGGEKLTSGVEYRRSPDSDEPNFIITRWWGQDGSLNSRDDGILVLYSAGSQTLPGKFKLNMSGHEEGCNVNCSF
jgi:Tfp pilus assembly protein PilE